MLQGEKSSSPQDLLSMNIKCRLSPRNLDITAYDLSVVYLDDAKSQSYSFHCILCCITPPRALPQHFPIFIDILQLAAWHAAVHSGQVW
jgi:hypothetical protein